MSRHIWRTRAHEGGFSFVELLVTIVVAGIAFAAMVPVFVQAAQTSSQDKARAVAVNIAQDAMENSRRLTFEQLVTANWVQNEETAAGEKPFQVQRTVEDQVTSASDARVVSKAVTIRVSWDRPAPAGAVVLKSVVYRQSAGPQIIDFTVAPWDADNEWLNDPNIALSALINAADIASMEEVTIGSSTIRGRVDFMITSVGGTVIPTISVPNSSDGQSVYATTWTAPGSPGSSDGYWSFKAVAFSARNYPGNTWEFVKRLESGPPAPVTNLAATSGADWVTLTWLPTVTKDLDHYVLERSDGASTVTLLSADDDSTATGFTDSGLAADTLYTYTIYAVDQVTKYSAATTISVGTGAATAVQPAGAMDLSVEAFGGQAKLTWTASASANVTGYLVYKDGDSATPVASVATPYCTIDQGWNTTATYQVKPIASGSNPAATAFATLTTGPPLPDFQTIGGVNWIRLTLGTAPTFELNIMNNVQTGKTATITLKYLGLEGMDSAQTIVPLATNIAYSSTNYGAQWTGLSGGVYQFSWVTSNNKTGSRVVQLTPPTSINYERCIP